jgi:hypothetical protein
MSYVTKHMAEQMAKHVLVPTPSGEFTGYWLREPGTGFYSLLIMGLPTGVTLTGDLQIGHGPGGSAIAYGYDLDWFGSQLSEDYLCSKFLRRVWQEDLVDADLKRRAEDEDNEDWKKKWAEVIERREIGDIYSHERMIDVMNDLGFDCPWEYSIGVDYPRGPAGWLCAAQQRFHELQQKQETT